VLNDFVSPSGANLKDGTFNQLQVRKSLRNSPAIEPPNKRAKNNEDAESAHNGDPPAFDPIIEETEGHTTPNPYARST
jgi:hypothetical protein